MVRKGITTSFILVLHLLGALLFGDTEAPYPNLSPGESFRDIIPLKGETSGYVTYLIDVPDTAFALRLAVSESPADLDIFIRHEEEIEDYAKVDAGSELDDYNESLFITRYSYIPLKTGTYYIDIAYQLEGPPVMEGDVQSEIPFRFTAALLPFAMEGALQPGEPFTSRLLPETGMVRTFTLDVPEETETLRVDIWNSPGDMDIVVNKEAPALGFADADYIAETGLSRESLVINRSSHPALSSGRYYITVIDQILDDRAEDFSIVVSFSEAPPEEVLFIPMVPVRRFPLEKALQSVVEITSEAGKGSGVLVSPEGHILSNWHVVKGLSGKPDSSPAVALSLEFDSPPEEMFRAKVLQYDKDLDLVLLQVHSGLYGQPLPKGYRFPYIPLGKDRTVRIGEDIHIIGFPGTGGTGSRAPVTYSRGVVSGFEKTMKGRLIKTDAQIHSGNSGGAALDKTFTLIGLPTTIVEEPTGHLGFIHSLSMIPPKWLEEIGK
jgi:S1-C subfamily serine protease